MIVTENAVVVVVVVVTIEMNCIHCLELDDLKRRIDFDSLIEHCSASTWMLAHENCFDEVMVENLLALFRTREEEGRSEIEKHENDSITFFSIAV